MDRGRVEINVEVREMYWTCEAMIGMEQEQMKMRKDKLDQNNTWTTLTPGRKLLTSKSKRRGLEDGDGWPQSLISTGRHLHDLEMALRTWLAGLSLCLLIYCC